MPMTVDQFKTYCETGVSALISSDKNTQKCVCCGVTLQETITGNRPTEEGNHCSKCYFEKIGDEIENHPIFIPRTKRSA